MRRLTARELLGLHDRIVQRTGGRHGLADPGALVSVLGRPFTGTPAGEFYPTLQHKAAALCHGLVREHPFLDANQRTGVAAAGLLMELNGRRITARPQQLVAFASAVAGDRHLIEEMAGWFLTHSEPGDREEKEQPDA